MRASLSADEERAWNALVSAYESLTKALDARLLCMPRRELDEILRAKPSSSKGRYLKKVVVSTTTGPGIPVDPAVTRNFTEA